VGPARGECYVEFVTRAELHRIVDDLPDESLDAAAMLLARASDPVLVGLEAAPLDDEPVTEEDRMAADEGWAAYRRGEAVDLDDFRAEREANG